MKGLFKYLFVLNNGVIQEVVTQSEGEALLLPKRLTDPFIFGYDGISNSWFYLRSADISFAKVTEITKQHLEELRSKAGY